MVETSNLVALDLETTGLDPRSSEIRLLQVSNRDETYVIDCRSLEVRPLVEALRKAAIVAHGAAFDWAFLYQPFGV